MKKLKFLLLLLTVSVLSFYSCTDSNPVEDEIVTTKSISLRTTLNEIKNANNISGRSSSTFQNITPCFSFVFPISLSYNNGTTITVSSQSGLIQALINETNLLYIDGIEFPFQVQSGNTLTTINNDADFFTLIQSCNFYTVNNAVFNLTCYQINFPISIVNASNQTVTINDQAELLAFVANQNGTTGTYQLNIVFPISVTQNNQSMTINNLYEFFTLNNNCPSSNCICPTVYSPVCVQTATGIIITYANQCMAECDGYTVADFVNCNNSGTSIWFSLGSCFNIAYPVQVQSQGTTITVTNNNQLLYAIFPSANNATLVFPVDVEIIGTNAQYTFLDQATMDATLDNICN